jgi:nucleoid-associated protein YgaU
VIFQGSRYRQTPVIAPPTPSGETPRALALREIAQRPAVLEHLVVDGERWDQLAARFYGDPTRYWLLMDANLDELNPLNLLRAGRRLRVPASEVP